MDNTSLNAQPRADNLRIRSDEQIHDKWALHAFAFQYETLPPRFRKYHPGREIGGEEMEGYFDEYVPKTYDSDNGEIIKKQVDELTVYCEECEVPARRNEKNEPQCPECGLICLESGPSEQIIRDPKAAGRPIKQ